MQSVVIMFALILLSMDQFFGGDFNVNFYAIASKF